MITATKLTLAEFLDLSQGDLTYELKAGEAIPKMSPKRFHSRLAGSLYTLLNNWCKDQGEVGIEWAVTLKRKGEDWCPVPDLLYISYDKLPLARFEDEACPFPPELVIEIISPGQSFGDLSEKATDYLKAGVDRVWLVDTQGQNITVFYPNLPPQTKRGQELLQDEVLLNLNITVEQVFQEAGLIR
jgi:Uma2 family endonuclease